MENIKKHHDNGFQKFKFKIESLNSFFFVRPYAGKLTRITKNKSWGFFRRRDEYASSHFAASGFCFFFGGGDETSMNLSETRIRIGGGPTSWQSGRTPH